MKPSLLNVLQELGFKDGNDTQTIIPPDAFEKLREVSVIEMIDEYELGLHGIYIPLDAERKMELVNRVLELKHGLIIDSIKEIDGLDQEGYELERLVV